MAKLPIFKRIAREDVREAPNWISTLLYPINSFFESAYNTLNRNVTFEDNIRSFYKEMNFSTDSSGAFVPFSFRNELPAKVKNVQICQISDSTLGSPLNSIDYPITCQWYESEGQIYITDISTAPVVPSVQNFTPTVTLVGGAGNTVPQYTTNTGRYTRLGNIVFVDVLLSGDGGNEGAGTGQFNVALPLAAGSSQPAGTFLVGRRTNSTTSSVLVGEITAGASTIALSYFDSSTSVSTFTGAQQSNTTRSIRLQFRYEVDSHETLGASTTYNARFLIT